MWYKLAASIFLLSMIFGTVSDAAAQEKSYSADQFDVTILIQEDGSLLVTETIAFTFVGEPFTYVFRKLPTELTDEIVILSALVNGRSYSPGTNAGQVEIRQGQDIHVRWHLEPTANSTHIFVLEYQIFGVVQQHDGADLLRYQPLPDEFEYHIDSSKVTVTFPETAVLQATPTVTDGTVQVNDENISVVFNRQGIDPNKTMLFEMNFNEGSVISAPSNWQAQDIVQDKAKPVWIYGSLLILLSGMGGAIWIWYLLQPPPKIKLKSAIVFEPPTKLAPAMAGVLNNYLIKPHWKNALATLFDLAGRELLNIEEIRKKRWWRKAEYKIVLNQEPVNLQEHEWGFLDLIFKTKESRQTGVKLSNLSVMVSSKRWGKFSEIVTEEFKAAGMIDEKRQTQRQWIIKSSLFLLGLAIIVWIIAATTLKELFGGWPIAIGISLTIVAVILLLTGLKLSILTDEASLLADEWHRFYHYMRCVVSEEIAVDDIEIFERFLPYAASYGLLFGWVTFFQEKEGIKVPAYFHMLARPDMDDMRVFADMADQSSTSGGHAADGGDGDGGGGDGGGGDGGGGSAGGGSSGAG